MQHWPFSFEKTRASSSSCSCLSRRVSAKPRPEPRRMAASRAPTSTAAAAADGGIEENAMAILDSSGIKDSRDLHDDRAAFLEAVRSACLAGDNPSAPSWRMYDGVFQVLRNSSSLELAVASFHLLMELGKQYPRTYLTDSGGHQSLVVVKESWLPFLIGNGSVSSEIGGNSRSSDHLFDPLRFSLLIETIVEPTNATDDNNGIKAIENMMLFQYLVNTLEADFVPRRIAYKESLDWVIFRESLLNMLLGSRKLVFKSFVQNCIHLLLSQYHPEAKDAVEDSIPFEGEARSASDLDSSLNYSSLESERTLVSLRKLFVMVMELDLIRKEADALGLTSRADGFRNPIMEVILDDLTYNISYLSPFLLAFVEWKWKLEIILQYFSKYCGKGAVRTRRSDNSQQDLKLERVLSFFLTATSTKAIVKKMGTEVAQLLLAHAYQVCISVQGDSGDSTTTEKIGASLQEISCNFISAFQNLKKVSP
ncbi:hypothetical protein SEVIR_1G139200v4 [Setaria viridis]|nr:negative regulator of systemic acquired resistance SNI1 isoform X2 [Setaria viridis]RCV06160.1 hypothetical protein SETIT_1G141400v2 [Setaria italica]TKW38803.1 hypothetical protein SEVIR_1G139200v2 [Setaria viridis]